MDASIVVFRLEGESRFTVVNRNTGSVEQIEVPGASSAGSPQVRGIAEAFVVDDLEDITTRKHIVQN